MAEMVARSSNPLPSAICVQEKASRNKRKFRSDPPLTDPSALPPPWQTECVNYDLFPLEKMPESSNLEHHTSVCNMCQTLMCGPSEGLELEEFQDADWSDLTETQLEAILLSNLDLIFKSAIKTITSFGYTEESATNAVLISGLCYGYKDSVSNVVDNALAYLRRGQEVDSTSRENLSEDLQKLEKTVLADMVSVIREVRPFFSTGDAMWRLLVCDTNVSHACAMDANPLNIVRSDDTSSGATTTKLESGSNSSHITPLALPESNFPISEKLNTMSSYPQSSLQSDISTVVGSPNLPYGRFSTSSNVPGMISNLNPGKENALTSSDHVEETTSSNVSQSPKEEKPVGGKKSHINISRRESILRQKSIHFEKSYRSLGSKAAFRACKHSGLGGSILDRKLKPISDSTNINLKSSSLKLGKAVGADKSQSDATLNFSFSAGLSSTLPCGTKTVSNPSPTPIANTQLSLSLPSASSSCVIPKHDCDTEAANCSNYVGIPSDKMSRDWVPQDKKDEMLLKLVPRVRELQAQLQDWTDWAQQKVMQATRRLSKDKAELVSLRQEKEEVARLQKERQNLEENTKKKLGEMEIAISKANGQFERANAAARRLEIENAQLRLEMEAAKLQALQSAASCQEASRRESEALKMSQSWDRRKASLQEELVTEKRKLSDLLQQLRQAKEHQGQLEAKWKQEEQVKNEALRQATSQRREREQIETSAKSQENTLKLKAENDLQRHKNDIRRIEQQLSQLRLLTDSSKIPALRWGVDKSYASRLSDGRKNSNAQCLAEIIDLQELGFEDIQRERECVMCLTEEMSVVFLPCAHQVVCTKCNELHEKQGMKECPSCRTPIQQRISVRSAGS